MSPRLSLPVLGLALAGAGRRTKSNLKGIRSQVIKGLHSDRAYKPE